MKWYYQNYFTSNIIFHFKQYNEHISEMDVTIKKVYNKVNSELYHIQIIQSSVS